MLDLKAKLAAAGVVSKKEVEDFDKREADKKAKKKQGQGRKPRSGPSGGRTDSKKNTQGNRGNQRGSHKGQNQKGKGYKGKAGTQITRSGGKGGAKSKVDVPALKALNKGQAYDRLRKVVEHARLDKGERFIPAEDESPFNFVSAKGKIGKLYLKDDTTALLREGQAAISSFMSHHGLAHCVLPKEIALSIAEIFPLWLRFLEGSDLAGKIEEPEPEEVVDVEAAKGAEPKVLPTEPEALPEKCADQAKVAAPSPTTSPVDTDKSA